MEQKKEPVLHRATEEPALAMSLYKFASLEDEVRAYIAINIEHFQRPMWPLALTFSKYYMMSHRSSSSCISSSSSSSSFRTS